MGNSKKILIVFGVLYALLYLGFYPQFYYMPDEQIYLRSAYLLQAGDVTIDDVEYNYGFTFKNGQFVPLYPLGQALWLMPFMQFGWEAVFLSGLAAVLLGFFVFYKIMGRLNLPRIYSLLFLLYPTFTFLGKTINSDMLSVLLVLTAFYFYLGRGRFDWAIAGIVFGLAAFVRLPSGILFAAFLLVSLCNNRTRAKYIFMGFVPLALIILLHNTAIYGGPFETAYSAASYFRFDIIQTPLTILGFAAILSLLYPFMFISQFLYRGRAWREIILSGALLLGFFGFYFNNPIQFRAETLLMGARYVLVLVPLLLVAYACMINNAVGKIREKTKIAQPLIAASAAIIVFVLLIGTVFVHAQYNERINNKRAVFDEIYENTEEGSLIITETPGIPLRAGEIQSPFAGMFFCECFGDRKSVPVDVEGGVERYVKDAGADNTYYARLWFEGRGMKVLVTKWVDRPR